MQGTVTGAASAGQRNLEYSSKPAGKIRKEVFCASHIKYEEEENAKSTSFYFLTSLKACGQKKDLDQASRIHDAICDRGLLEKNLHIRSALVSMFAKCGALARAQEVLDELPVQDVPCWNALIAGYAQHGQGCKAMGCFQQMRNKGLSPNAVTYVCALKACTIMRDIDMGEKLSNEIISQGLLSKSIVLGNALVDMYAKCGVLTRAQKVLDMLPIRNVVSWSALIAGYVQQGQGHEALRCFQWMRSEDLSPDAIMYAHILKACAITQNIDMGTKIHDEIVSQGFLKQNIKLGNSLLHMYAKCGILAKARKVFDELAVRDVVSWSALIAGYAQQGQAKEALSCFQQMRSEGLSPNAFTYAGILKACGIIQDIDMAKKFHDEIDSQGLLKMNSVLGNVLIDMYAKCGRLKEAQGVLDELHVRDVDSWNSLVVGYSQAGQGQEAMGSFQRMQGEGILPDAMTYAFMLKACSFMKDPAMGKKFHNNVIIQNLLSQNLRLGCALVDMYAKCGMVTKAQKVLDELPVRNVACWSALIAGYSQQGQGLEALRCFHRMHGEGFTPDAISYVCILRACGTMQDIDMGKTIHDEIISQGLLKTNIILGNALVDMYAKCGEMMKAEKVLSKLPILDVISWSSLIAGYAQHGWSQEALGCFQQMCAEGLRPDVVTYVYILKVCSISQDIEMGQKLHDEIVSQGLMLQSIELCNALLDMYAKCGVLEKAQNVLDELPVRDVISWNALIGGYVQQGKVQEASCCFQWMQRKGFSPDIVSWNALLGGYAQQGLGTEALDCFHHMQMSTTPDAITLSSVLNACSHSGLVGEGQMYFDTMKDRCGITADKEHYTCMVDLFGRAGLFNKAIRLIKLMPSFDHPPLWSALSSACRNCGNVVLGKLAYEHAIQIDASDAAAYVLMSDIYAAAGMQQSFDSN